MESPFVFGKKVIGNSFTDREQETARLVSNFNNRVNTIIISPRRWGKSSLVKKAGELACNGTIVMVYIDSFGLRDAREFYTMLATSVIKETSNTLESIVDQVKRFFSRVTPKISFGTDPVSTFELAFELESVEKNYQELLDLPEKIAEDKKIKLVVCIDEFQNTALFSESMIFHKRLRSSWQNHQHVSYCLYGSKQHMMQSLFEKQSMPFYKFGEIIHLGKISLPDWIAFIIKQFQNTGKLVSDEYAHRIATTVKCHSYYVQQLSHLVWERSDNAVEEYHFEAALDDLIYQNAMLFQRDTESLSDTQLNFMKALASGTTKGFSFKEIMDRYKLGSSANVVKIKKALLDKELIEIKGQEAEFLDPVYELWFAREIL